MSHAHADVQRLLDPLDRAENLNSLGIQLYRKPAPDRPNFVEAGAQSLPTIRSAWSR